jgi:hypothetical protein
MYMGQAQKSLLKQVITRLKPHTIPPMLLTRLPNTVSIWPKRQNTPLKPLPENPSLFQWRLPFTIWQKGLPPPGPL